MIQPINQPIKSSDNQGKMRNQLRPKHLIATLNMALSSHHTLTVITRFQANFSGRTVCFMGKESPWLVADMQLLGVDMDSAKTLCAIHRGRGWPYSSVKQLVGRKKEGDTDVTLWTNCGRKRKITKKRQEKKRERDQGSAQDEHQANTTSIRGRDKYDGVSGDQAKVHEDVCQTVVLGYEARGRDGPPSDRSKKTMSDLKDPDW